MKAKITIEGMSCGNCASHVEESLSKIAGAKGITVNPGTGQAFLETPEGVTEEQLKEADKDAGYNPVKVELEN